MATVKSTQVTNATASRPTFSEPNELQGRLRISYFDYTVPSGGLSANDIIQLNYLPAGRCRVLKSLSWVHSTTAFDSNADIDVGVEAHTDQDGSTSVSATTDDLLDGGDIATADTPIQFGTGTNADNELTRLVNAQDKVILQASILTAGATAADTLEGFVVYVND